MARLPTPGSDNGTWGDILNEFLLLTHKPDGQIKDNVISTAQITDGTIAESNLNTAVQQKINAAAPAADPVFTGSVTVPAPTNPSDAANKSYVDTTVSSGTPDADASTKGKIQLAGDLGGTAAAPTVPGLAAKADTSTVNTALAGKEPTITAGTTGQYWRGDKSWQTLPSAPVTSVNTQTGAVVLAKGDVGLGNVDNTSDANKPVSSAQASADNLRLLKSGDTMNGNLNVIGNYTIKDSAVATKSYRFRTSGSSLDFETAGARMYFSTWDNPDFTGVQHNHFSADIYGLQATNHWYWRTSIDGTNVLDIDTGTSLINVGDAVNLTLGATTGTKIGTSTSQKLGFYNAAPVVQPSGNALTALSTLGLIGSPTLTKSDVGLGNVDNTSDANKPVSTATQTALNLKLDKTGGTATGPVTIHGTNNTTGTTNLLLENNSSTPLFYVDNGGHAVFGPSTSAVSTVSGVSPYTPNFQINAPGPAASVLVSRFSANANGPRVSFLKSYGTSIGDMAALASSGIVLGQVAFAGTNGTNATDAAAISAYTAADNTGLTYTPTNIGFLTSNGTNPTAERLTIASTGSIGINNTLPAVALDVTGEVRSSTAGTNATSVVTVGGTQTLTSKTLTSPVINSPTGFLTGAAKITVGTSTPSSPTTGDIWIDTN